MNNFILTNLDTDSISFCKKDFSEFTKEEDEELLKSLNSFFPEEIKFAPDGEFKVFIVLKAKNYISLDKNNKIKLKGSALKSSSLEPKLKEMLNECINCLLFDKQNEIPNIYYKYIKEASNITDITPWAKKVTLSATTYRSERKNETNIIDAIQGTEYVEGDKVRIYTKSDGTLKLADKFDCDYNKHKYYEKIYKTVLRFSTVIDTSMFKNFKNKGNKNLLEEILNT